MVRPTGRPLARRADTLEDLREEFLAHCEARNPQGTGAASQDIEISDVTLPIAALLIASVFEELDGSRIGHRSAAGG